MKLHKGRPQEEAGRLPKELRTYDFLDALGVDYEQMERTPDASPERRRAEEETLDAMICKNIVLCNRKRTQFYLLMLPKDKSFVTGDVTGQMGVSHLSFADAEHMAELLDLTPGSVSVLGLMNDRDGRVQLVIDRAVLRAEHFACHPCVNTASVRFSMEDFLNRVLPALGHPPVYVDLPEGRGGKAASAP